MVLSPYLSRESSIFNEIWCADADSRSKNGHMTKYQSLKIQNGGRFTVEFREEFKKIAYDMLEAPSCSDCDAACMTMSSFCSQHVVVKGWYEWWLKRKEHIFHAFKPTNTPCANLAEIGHVQIAAWAHTNATFVKMCNNIKSPQVENSEQNLSLRIMSPA